MWNFSNLFVGFCFRSHLEVFRTTPGFVLSRLYSAGDETWDSIMGSKCFQNFESFFPDQDVEFLVQSKVPETIELALSLDHDHSGRDKREATEKLFPSVELVKSRTL